MLNIDKINNMLQEGKSVKYIRSSLNISEKSFQKQIKQLGYKYNQKTKQYEKVDKSIVQKNKDYCNNIGVINQTDVAADIDIKKVADLVKNYDMIKELLTWFKNKEYENDIIEVIQDNRIEIDIDTDETKRTTILVNKKIYDEFNEFCQKHKEYDKKDLISMALKEYVQKYD
jgi:fructose-1-phosphate kinase PfkB-like protein